MSASDFIRTVAPIAVRLRLEGSVMFPSVRIAQSGLETGWTLHPWNNVVGLKVGTRPPNPYWKGAYVNKGTWEVVNGRRIEAVEAFRAYDSIEDCYRDQDELFKLPRYARVRAAHSPEEQADMLQACGYATDPAYASKIKSLIGQSGLKQYDEEVVRMLEELQAQIAALQSQVGSLQNQVQALASRDSVPVPEWARAAVDAAVAAGVVDTPEGGSYDFYRLLTVLHRLNLIPGTK